MVRIRPIDIEVPADEPFANDRLDRRDQAEAIAAILKRIEGPFVLAVDAPWGEGKTTFLRMSQAYLRKNQFLVIDFNAWETDFSDDPFIALTTEIIQGLERLTTDESTDAGLGSEGRNEIAEALHSLTEQTQSLINWKSLMMTANFVLQHTTGIDLSALRDASSDKETQAATRIKSYTEQKKLMKDFIESLSIIGTITENYTDRPLVICIDELDRCRPTYAIELLETVKHLFSVENIVFIFGLNREQLAHSVRAVYGERFDAERYLSRLIDIDVILPRSDTTAFVASIMDSCDIAGSLRNNVTRDSPRNLDDTQAMIQEFLGSSELSIREIAQSIHHLALVMVSLNPNQYPLLQITVILLTLRSIDRNLYNRFTRGEATDAEVVDNLFNRPGLRGLSGSRKGSYIEAHIIRAYQEISKERRDAKDDTTPLLMKYQENMVGSETVTHEEQQYAKGVIDRYAGVEWPDGRVYSTVVIGRIELFAKSSS